MSIFPNIIRRTVKAIKYPHLVKAYLIHKYKKFSTLKRQKKYPQLVGALSDVIFNENVYIAHLKKNYHYIQRDVGESVMELDPKTRGLSQTLLTHGEREVIITEVFRKQLENLSRREGDLNIIEVGANIGFFVLVESEVISENSAIHAMEPHPGNYTRLLRHIELNMIEDLVQPCQIAISDKIGSTNLELSKKSNQHRLQHDISRNKTIEVDTETIDQYIVDSDLSFDDVHVIRMDIQGEELRAFHGMKRLLQSTGPLVIFFETHDPYLTTEEQKEMVSILKNNGFEFIAAANGYAPVEINQIEDIVGKSLQVIVKKT